MMASLGALGARSLRQDLMVPSRLLLFLRIFATDGTPTGVKQME